MYSILSFLQNMLINPNGIIVAANFCGEDVNEKLEEILHWPTSLQ
ncbi:MULTISPECIES: hypothetical protein [unclassified Sphingobacterium]|nr:MULTISPECIES: hypothetical protein [unclassified Sphingobacterium]MCS3556138.1 hypothetical protein [Sphingobacterium sp. JUb21]TCR08514.1 hypothetical protein EDF66_10361 [Sphingobacterium sp. JUb20]